MQNFSIAARIQAAALASILATLLASLFVAGGIYLLGRSVDQLRERELMGMQAANGILISLYQMEWGVTRPGSQQILLDQRRQFAHWIDLAQDRATTGEQRRSISTIARQVVALTDALNQAALAGRIDDELDRRMREIHTLVNELLSTDDAAVLAVAARAHRQATILMGALLMGAIGIPLLCLAALWSFSSRLGRSLRAIRSDFDAIVPRVAAANLASEGRIKAIDDALTGLGYPPPDPALER